MDSSLSLEDAREMARICTAAPPVPGGAAVVDLRRLFRLLDAGAEPPSSASAEDDALDAVRALLLRAAVVFGLAEEDAGEDRGAARRVFAFLDADDDGAITVEELRRGLRELQRRVAEAADAGDGPRLWRGGGDLTTEQLERVVVIADTNGDGVLDLDELTRRFRLVGGGGGGGSSTTAAPGSGGGAGEEDAAVLRLGGDEADRGVDWRRHLARHVHLAALRRQHTLPELFRSWDADGDGVLTLPELNHALRGGDLRLEFMTMERVRALLRGYRHGRGRRRVLGGRTAAGAVAHARSAAGRLISPTAAAAAGGEEEEEEDVLRAGGFLSIADLSAW